MKKAQFEPDKAVVGASYPPPHEEKCRGRRTWQLTGQYGLTQFGVNRVELAPGSWSTQRHWHRSNDEVVVVVAGELVLVTDEGEETLRAGDCVAFRMNDPNAHHLQNRASCPRCSSMSADATRGMCPPFRMPALPPSRACK